MNDIPLRSASGVDYSPLRDLLAQGQWEEADRQTEEMILKVAGQTLRGYLISSDIYQFPCQDLQTIDQLWVYYSQGRFGFSVQTKIWNEVQHDWKKYRDRIGWRVNERMQIRLDLTYNLTAPYGHLPAALMFLYATIAMAKRIQECKI